MSLKIGLSTLLMFVVLAACGESSSDGAGTGGAATGGTSTGATGGTSSGGTSSGGTGGTSGGSAGSTGGSAGTPSGGGTAGTGTDGGTCTPPSDGLWATFEVVADTYRANITNANGIQQAIDLWTGKSTSAIPNGKLLCSPAPYNCGWGFHQDPATIEFADFTTEVCDGTPSYLDANCASFGEYYCPWSAKLVDLRDCRTDKSCPVVPKT